MAVNFPSNPTNGQTITVSGITYAYDSTQGVWSDSPQGLTQAIDALTDVDTSTVAPTNGQVLQWNSTDSEWQPADSSAGVTVYATIDDLPLSGVAEGSMALVDSTDKLYIFSDAGWYSISIVNTTPSISGVNATYTLATDGTATVVTVTATDPEGIPLTYSIVSDTSGNIATVTQGTGANTNQWTITPSTNSANAGNFTLVFRASDGVNVASASSTFTLSFASPIITTGLHGADWNGNTITTVANGGTGTNNTSTYDYELTGMSADFGAIKILMPDIWTEMDDDDGLIVVAITDQSATFNNRGIVSIGISDSTDANQILGGFTSYATSSVYQTWLHPSATTTVGTVGGTFTVNSDPGVGDQDDWDLAMRHRASTNNLKFWVRPKTGSYANQWIHIASHTGYTFTPANFRLYMNQRVLTSPTCKVTLLDATSFSSTLTF